MPFRVSGINFWFFRATVVGLAKVSQAFGKVLQGSLFLNNPNNDNNNYGCGVVSHTHPSQGAPPVGVSVSKSGVCLGMSVCGEGGSIAPAFSQSNF